MSLEIFNVEADVEVQEERDSVGFKAWETDIYPAVVKAAFLNEYESGSKYIEVICEITDEDGNTMEHSEREVVWSANTKGAYYIDKKTKAKKQLIGLNKMNSLGELLAGKALKDSIFETKVHKVYDKDANGEINKELPTLTEWCGKSIYVGLQKVRKNKQVKQGKAYVDTAEAVEVNEFHKFFNENKQSNLEAKKDVKAEFCTEWVNTYKGKTRDIFKAPAGGAAPSADGIPQATAAPLDLG